jgi:hypothetical protein
MKCFDTEGVIIKSWCDNPEGNALAQAKNLANLPFVFSIPTQITPDKQTALDSS